MARSPLALLSLLVPLVLAAQQDPQFRQAGVCSRCHVAQVLEWSASKHPAAGAACQSCHGPSAAHVANERNQVKPDRLPQGDAAVTALCASCHANGCPKTARTSGCQTCHHQHALSNPEDTQLRTTALTEDPRLPAFRQAMDEGERQVSLTAWPLARDAFARAVKLFPSDRRAAARLRMTERRLNPQQPGFEILGPAFDPDSGLPLLVRIADLGIEMRLVPGGEADIGSASFPDAQPVHAVYAEPFYLAVHELSQRQWTALDPDNPSPHKDPGLPVHGVSWQDARQWIERLNARVPGAGFRLPSEAEWERAALRHGVLDEEAWFRDNSAPPAAAGAFRELDAYLPHRVASKKPNPAGFYDLLGNVAEWCSTLYRPYPYDPRDGRESLDVEGLRVLRGGHFADAAGDLHPAFRHAERPARRNLWNGFRLARSPFLNTAIGLRR